MSMMLWLAKTLAPNYFKLARDQNSIQVVSICFSHYCELSVWALQVAGKTVVEHDYVPGQHVLPAMRIRLCDENGKRHFSKSSRVIGAREQAAIEEAGGVDKLSEDERKKFRKRDASVRATAVPVAVLPDGNVLLDSWELAEYSGLKPVPEEWKKIFDNELGPLSRQAAYSILLKPQNISQFHRLCTMNRSWFIRTLWTLFIGSFVVKTMTKIFTPNNPTAVKQCKDSLKNTFDKLDKIVMEKKGRYLLGEELSLADIAMASLAAPVLLPPLYCAGKFNGPFQALYDNDTDAKVEVDQWRNTVAGKYIMEIYQQHRIL